MSIDWNSIFVPSLGLAEIIVRGSLMYLGLFAVLRFVGRRQAGSFGPADLLVIVLIADAAQNGLGKEYGSVTEGLILVLTIVAWEYLIDWAQYRRIDWDLRCWEHVLRQQHKKHGLSNDPTNFRKGGNQDLQGLAVQQQLNRRKPCNVLV